MSDNKVAWGGAGISTVMIDKENNVKVAKSFSDIMSEDLAENLQQREVDNYRRRLARDSSTPGKATLSNSDTSNDHLIAELLQQDLDRAHDQQVNREEKHLNKNSKLAISFDKYRACPTTYEADSDEEFPDLDDENRFIDTFEERQLHDPVMPACGYAVCDDKIITKHDSGISGRRNAERMMNLPPGMNTGDAGGFDMHLSNKVYNELKVTTRRKPRKIHKEKEDQSTSELALNPGTRMLLLKWLNFEILKNMSGTVAVGKESLVIHALGGKLEGNDLAHHCALKVFKTTLSDFKTREQYLKCDDRYKSKIPKNNTKKTVNLWAEKEFHNLNRIYKAGIPCPVPYLVKENVLLMSFIGTEHLAAPKLKHVSLSFAEWCLAYEQVIEVVNKLYKECNLVHADLSEYNMLWHDEKCWFIDVGQAVEPKSKESFIYLLRDCKQIVTFFESKEIPNLPSPITLFNSITGFDMPDDDENISYLIEKKIDKFRCTKNKLRSEEHFDYLWNEAQKEVHGEEE